MTCQNIEMFMSTQIKQFIALAAVALCISVTGYGQKAAKQAVEERNVRAHMEFLASDAMQGRGSGTQFERITAEYVGSQFMQFGLEPAGDVIGGKTMFVQTASLSRGGFAAVPTMKIGATSLEHGKEMLVLRTNAGSASGPLQKLAAGAKANAGAAVFISSSAADQRALTIELQGYLTSGASIVIVEETPQLRTNWAAMSARRVAFTVSTAKPAVMVAVSKETAASLANAADGTTVEFGGTLSPVQVQLSWNAVGKITGSDAKLGSEVILLSSHLDHLGVRPNNAGDDKIFNGADDDASGTAAVIELARVIGAGKKPKRTVYFVCFGSEESGGIGSNFFANNLSFPKEKLIANLQWEMIGRPDAKVKPEELWLTGYERSNLGPELAKRGAKLLQDPHPSENFFQRSDNYTLARQGIIAHTVSSFGLHTDYHRASDEIKTIDFVHMTRSINSMIGPIEWLANSDFRPEWNAGMKP